MALISFVGGPHDGAVRDTTGAVGPFTWFDGSRMFRRPGKDRSLYQLGHRVKTERGVAVAYLYMGLRTVMCQCGGYRDRGVQCPACGSIEVWREG